MGQNNSNVLKIIAILVFKFLDNQITGQFNLQLLRNRITNCQVKAGGITSYQQM